MSPRTRPPLLLLTTLTFAMTACPPAATVKPTATAQTDRPSAESANPAHAEVAGTGDGAGSKTAAQLPTHIAPVYFDLDSAQLQQRSQESLAELADALRQVPGARVRIEGHTCELGTSEYNLALGLRRAQVTRDYLVRLGVQPGAVETISFGEEQPAEEGNVEQAHALNRRSELRVEVRQAHADR